MLPGAPAVAEEGPGPAVPEKEEARDRGHKRSLLPPNPPRGGIRLHAITWRWRLTGAFSEPGIKG